MDDQVYLNIDYTREIVKKFISSYEKMRDKLYYPVKTPLDDLVCPICGGRYKRRDKSKHSKGQKHQKLEPVVLCGNKPPYLEFKKVYDIST